MKPKILVADDDFDNRTIIQESLEAELYDVILATNGEEALAKIQSERPDVVLLDMSMPKMNGWEVARRVRQDAAFKNMAIIAFTAHALAGQELKAKSAGCDDYISKPCVPKVVVSRIAHWVQQNTDRLSKEVQP